MNNWCICGLFTHILTKCRFQEAKFSVKNIFRQRCAVGFIYEVKRDNMGKEADTKVSGYEERKPAWKVCLLS
jgi:hypothetical protein